MDSLVTFNPELTGAAYSSLEEQLSDLRALLDLYLQYALQDAPEQEPVFPRFGSAPDAEVKRLLNGAWAYFESRVFPTIDGQSNLLFWIFSELYVGRFERLCFMLAAALRADRKYEKVYGYLNGNAQESYPSIALAYSLCSLCDEPPLEHCVTFPNSGTDWHIFFEGWGSGLATMFVLRESAFAALLGRRTLDASIAAFSSLYIQQEETPYLPEIIARRPVAEDIAGLYESCFGEEQPLLVLIAGEKGSGRRFLFKHAAAMIERDMLLVDIEPLAELAEGDFFGAVRALASCCLYNALIPLLCWESRESPALSQRLRRIISLLEQFGLGCVFAAGPEGAHIEDSGDYLCFPYALGRMTPQEASLFWEHYAGAELAPTLDIPQLVNKYRLTARQIQDTLSIARLHSPDGRAGQEEIAAAVRNFSGGEGSQHCRKVKPFFSVDDIILPGNVRTQILRIIERIKQDYYVNTQWGFDQKYAYGKGIGILLYGQPGTGKSMCAHVIAHALGLDLLQVDLSSVVSKYVGETEKNLTSIFKQAEKSNTILFFDEADSLFAQRSSEMSGANDRYANIETSHLLQKMEEFGGVCILTTNMAMNFDKAFFRRLEFMVNIPMPDEETRAILWRRAFPEKCAIDESIPFDILVKALEMTPSEIKSVAKNAAFLAVYAKSGKVRFEHIWEALKIDYAKRGKAAPSIPGVSNFL